MKLFVGLGNPGQKYSKTRHNAGWIALDQLCEAEGFTNFLGNKKFHGEVANGLLGKWQIIALKPQTFMNKSGQSVQAIMQYYQIEPHDILVLQDDIDLPFGAIKLKYGGSHGGHNGIRDLIAKLGTDKFRRLKIGIGRPVHPEHGVVDYVLNTFSGTDMQRFKDHEQDIRERVGSYLKNTG
jgi:PTH1 family peptidyl-tRNA hydrolase